MKNLIIRSLTGLVYLVVFIGALLLGPYSFGLFFITINLLALNEFYTIINKLEYQSLRINGLAGSLILFISIFLSYIFDFPISICVVCIPIIALIFVIELYRKKTKPVANIAFTILGLVYISVPLSLFNYFAFFDNKNYTFQIILGFFILLWINDTFAYIFGISFGKHSLFKRISPKKSWEGFIGGTIITIVTAFFLSRYFNLLNSLDWVIVGIIISITGVYGDLVESMLKRSAETKDSGKFLPGHGGMLDRIDSVLLSAPLVYMYLILFK